MLQKWTSKAFIFVKWKLEVIKIDRVDLDLTFWAATQLSWSCLGGPAGGGVLLASVLAIATPLGPIFVFFFSKDAAVE